MTEYIVEFLTKIESRIMTVYFQHDWQSLVGEEVTVRQNGRTVRQGVVDAVMNDGSILWLMADGPHLRQMMERDAGYEVWLSDKS